MLIVISPRDLDVGFDVEVNNVRLNTRFATYDKACSVANSIASAADDPVVTIDYSRCLRRD